MQHQHTQYLSTAAGTAVSEMVVFSNLPRLAVGVEKSVNKRETDIQRSVCECIQKGGVCTCISSKCCYTFQPKGVMFHILKLIEFILDF